MTLIQSVHGFVTYVIDVKDKIHIQTEENLTCNHAAENIGNEIKNDKSWLNVKCVYIKTDKFLGCCLVEVG